MSLLVSCIASDHSRHSTFGLHSCGLLICPFRAPLCLSYTYLITSTSPFYLSLQPLSLHSGAAGGGSEQARRGGAGASGASEWSALALDACERGAGQRSAGHLVQARLRHVSACMRMNETA